MVVFALLPGATQTTVYTVPAGRTLLVRSIDCVTLLGGPGQLGLRTSIGLDNRTWWFRTIATGSHVQDDQVRAFNPGENIIAAPGTADVILRMSGTLLLGEPE
jgi:hypothetical protein